MRRRSVLPCLLRLGLLGALLLGASPGLAAPPAKKQPPAKMPAPLKKQLEFPQLRSRAEADRVTVALLALDGVRRVVVDARTRLAVVDYDGAQVSLERLLAASVAAGIEAREYALKSRFPTPIKLTGG